MSVKLPRLIETYVKAHNAYDEDAELACFSENATVLDEGETLTGKKAIREWMEKTRKKYTPQLKPLGIEEKGDEVIVTTEVSGTFDGSPVTLDYHFTIRNNLIEDLRVVQP
jgi:ketosteroid isomerase-like protein